MKREAVKYIRDAAKSAYQKDTECYISGDTDQLELHHYYSISQLYKKWLKKTGYNSEDVEQHRDEFIQEHYDYIYKEVVTLKKAWHRMLHIIYGESPLLSTGPKQKRLVEKKRKENYVQQIPNVDSGESESDTG